MKPKSNLEVAGRSTEPQPPKGADRRLRRLEAFASRSEPYYAWRWTDAKRPSLLKEDDGTNAYGAELRSARNSVAGSLERPTRIFDSSRPQVWANSSSQGWRSPRLACAVEHRPRYQLLAFQLIYLIIKLLKSYLDSATPHKKY